MGPNEIYVYTCEKDHYNHFNIKCQKENLFRIFVTINASTEAFEVFVSKRPNTQQKPDFVFKTNRFFIKYHNFPEISKIFLSIFAKEPMKYEICLKFLSGFIINFQGIFIFFILQKMKTIRVQLKNQNFSLKNENSASL